MKKNTLMAFLIVVLLILGWYQLFQTAQDKQSKYDEAKSKAEKYEKKGFYVEAIEEYQKLLEMEPEESSYQKKIADNYLKLEDDEMYISSMESAISLAQDREELYAELADYYIELEEYTDAFAVLDRGLAEYPDSKAIVKLYDSIVGKYEVVDAAYAYITEFRDNIAMASTVGEWVNDIGSPMKSYNVVLDKALAEKVSLKDESLICAVSDGETFRFSANKEGRLYYYDLKGRKRLSPDESYEYLGVMHDGYALVCKDGSWGYINSELEERSIKYDAATAFLNGRAAVCENGKWKIINNNLKSVTSKTYEDIWIDEFQTCSMNERIFARKNGKYAMLDLDGKEISSGYEDVKGFISDSGYAAVCKAGKWGLINAKGKMILECKYEELNPSNNSNYAAFKQSGKWGYIKKDGTVIIEPQFTEVKAINDLGYAAVKSDNSNWYFIQLYRYQ